MALRQILSKAVMPSLEKELNRSVAKEVAAMDDLLCSMAPQVFGYAPKSSTAAGAFAGTALRKSPAVRMEKVHFKAPQPGLFRE